jgi:hypothetical protein
MLLPSMSERLHLNATAGRGGAFVVETLVSRFLVFPLALHFSTFYVRALICVQCREFNPFVFVIVTLVRLGEMTG